MVDALSAARPGIVGKTGPNINANVNPERFGGQGPAAFKSRPPVLPNPGPNPNISGDREMRFIPPLALFNDASQWVNRLMFNRPMTFMQNPDSNPPLKAQYFTPPPQIAQNLGAGKANLQLQLGQMLNQAQQLTMAASNFYGG